MEFCEGGSVENIGIETTTVITRPRRNSNSQFQVYFPGIIHIVYVLRPSGFFQKAISEVSSKFFKEEFKFKLIVCASLEELYDHVEKSQVTQDMGGDLIYSHHEWIQQRIVRNKIIFDVTITLTDLNLVIRKIFRPNTSSVVQFRLIHESHSRHGIP